MHAKNFKEESENKTNEIYWGKKRTKFLKEAI